MIRATLGLLALSMLAALTLATHTVPMPLSKATRAAAQVQVLEPHNLKRAILAGPRLQPARQQRAIAVPL